MPNACATRRRGCSSAGLRAPGRVLCLPLLRSLQHHAARYSRRSSPALGRPGRVRRLYIAPGPEHAHRGRSRPSSRPPPRPPPPPIHTLEQPVAPPQARRRARPAARPLARSRAGAPSPPRDRPGPAGQRRALPFSCGDRATPPRCGTRPSTVGAALGDLRSCGTPMSASPSLADGGKEKAGKDGCGVPQGPDSGVWATGGRRSGEATGTGGTGLALNGRGATSYPGGGREVVSCENRLWSRHCSSVPREVT